MGRTMGSNNQQNYNVSNVFNDYDAFCCNTPTTYYKINQFAFVSHTNKNYDVPVEEFSRQGSEVPPFADYENNDPFSQHQMQHPAPLQISIPRQVMAPIKASVFNQGAAAVPLNQKALVSQLKLARPPVQAIPQASYNVENDEQEEAEEEAEADTLVNNNDEEQQQQDAEEVEATPVVTVQPLVVPILQATPVKAKPVVEEDEEYAEREDDEEEYQQDEEDEEDDDEDFVEEKVEKQTRSTKNSSKKASKRAAKKSPSKTRRSEAQETKKPAAAAASSIAAAPQQEGPIQVNIKPARKTRSNFISFFPEKLYCAPYKYDVRVRFAASENHEKYNKMLESGDYQNLIFKLLDGETHKPIKSNSKGDKALIVEKCKKSDLLSEEGEDHDDQGIHANEVVYRVCFTVCSFHNHRKPFVIQCTEKNSELLLFESNPFHIYARKNNKDKNGDVWGAEEVPSESVKTLFSGLESEEQTSNEEIVADDSEKSLASSKRSREEGEDKKSSKKQKPLRIQLPAQFQKQAGEFSSVE